MFTFWDSQKPALPTQLHVLLISRRFPITGRTQDLGFLWLIARGLTQKGHRVTVLSRGDSTTPAQVVKEGVQVFYLKENKKALSVKKFADLVREKFVELHRENPFHLLHSVDASAIKISKYKSEYNLAVAYDVDATQISHLFSILGMGHENLTSLIKTGASVTYAFLKSFYGGDRQLLKTADGVFVTSPQQRVILERYYLVPYTRIYHVPYGIDVGDLSPRDKPEELRRRLNLPETAKAVVTISDMMEVGEIKNLLEAFAQAVIKKPNARLIIVGNGPRFKEIEYEMLMRALGSKVIMTGAVKDSEIPDYIALSDVFVNLSSRTTGFEPSLIEAMAQKKVIIGSEVSPMTTIVEPHNDGFLIRPADINELTGLLLGIFNGQLPTESIGESARQKVLNIFDSEKMIIETIQAYYDILRSTGLYRRHHK